MKSEFESTRMKALKLAALAARGEGGEAENARRMLEQLLRRHGMTMAQISDETQRAPRRLDVRVNERSYGKDKNLARLAMNCLGYVLQAASADAPYRAVVKVCTVMVRSGRKDRAKSFFVVLADLTPEEFDDWRACFEHYKPEFLKTRAHHRLVLKQTLSGFLHKHDLFAPTPANSQARPLTKAELAALIAAMRGSSGDTWSKGHKLQQGDFLLPA